MIPTQDFLKILVVGAFLRNQTTYFSASIENKIFWNFGQGINLKLLKTQWRVYQKNIVQRSERIKIAFFINQNTFLVLPEQLHEDWKRYFCHTTNYIRLIGVRPMLALSFSNFD